MTATILKFPSLGPVFGGQALQDTALELARAVYVADVPSESFWLAVATLLESPIESDRAMGNAAYAARLLATLDEAPYVHVEEPTPTAVELTPGWLMAAGITCIMASAMIAGYVLSPIF